MGESDLVRFLQVLINSYAEWFLGFLTILVLMGLSWIRYRVRPRGAASNSMSHERSDSIRNLFWELDCYLDDHEPRKAFLRSLTPTKATLLTTDPSLYKGGSLRIDLSPILEGADQGKQNFVEARIVRCTNVGGAPVSYLLSVQFLSGRTSAIQRYMNESMHRLHEKSQAHQLEVL